MNYQEFVAAVECAVKESLPSNRNVQTHRVVKNNGSERVGITISEREVNLSPTIYLEEYYERYLDAEPLEEIVSHILDIYEEVKFEHNWDTTYLTDYERVKGCIVYKLIHTKKNCGLLRNMPSKEYLDLSMVCYVLLEMECGTATVLVTDQMMHIWKVEKEEVFARAEENTKRMLPEQFYNMECVIRKVLDEEPDMVAGAGLYVLSNNRGCLGAATILYEGILEKIGSYLGEDFYVIPSSVHEVLIYPESVGVDRERIDEIIDEVNELHVEPEEFLSDHAYFYNRETKRLSM